MIIKVNELKSHVKSIKELIDDYELAGLNFYNVLNQESSYWKDGKSQTYFDNSAEDKKEIAKFNLCLDQYLEYYNKLIGKVQSVGKVIEWNSNYYNQIYDTCGNYINKVDYVIEIYNSLNMYQYPEVVDYLRKELDLLKSIKSRLIDIREKYGNTLRLLDSANNEFNKSIENFAVPSIPMVELHKEIV